MSISNQASGLRSGVCTSTTRPSSPYTGQVIFETDTNRMYVWNGSSWVIPNQTTQNPEGFEIITPTVSGTGVSLSGQQIVFSASTEIIVDNVFSSTYRNYLIKWDAQASAGGSVFTLQFRTNTTVTSNYQYAQILAGNGNPTGSTQTAQGAIRVGANDTNGYNAMSIDVYSPNIATPTREISTFARNTGNLSELTWGAQTDNTQFTGFRISVGSGNMTGTATVYGYRN